MNALNLLRLQADHNHWMNERLYAVCADMRDEERRRDLGAFFRSIHGTFNHLLLVDRLWMGRLTGRPFAAESLAQELYADFDELRAQKDLTDRDIEHYIDGLDEAALSRRVTYRSLMSGRENTLPVGVILSHLFHHQTHHRGQITTLIGQLGYDFGETDMIWMPGVSDDYL